MRRLLGALIAAPNYGDAAGLHKTREWRSLALPAADQPPLSSAVGIPMQCEASIIGSIDAPDFEPTS